MAAGVGGAERLVSLDADGLIAAACEATGLSDFGPADEWEPFFRVLVDALNDEAQLNVLGRLMCRSDALHHLCTRLRIEDHVRRHPEVLDREVVAPVIITGPARSGTSILQELLAEDPQLRAPLAYEMVNPLPPAGATADDLRRVAECEFDLWGDVTPEFEAVHELRAGLPEECLWLMAPMFDLGFWATNVNVPTFMMTRALADRLPVYRYHRKFLQVLQGDTAPTWVLKSPLHLGFLAALFEVYPDARVVRTHRDPMKTIPSSVSTLLHGRWTRSDAFDPVGTGASTMFGMEMTLNSLAAQPSLGTIAEVHYLDLLRDPVGAIRTAYSTLGLEFTEGFGGRIVDYLAQRPQTKHGHHRYSPTDFGFSEEQIRTTFEPYTTAFGVGLESP